MSNANLIAEARLNAPHSEDESLIMRLVVALEAAEPRTVTTIEELDALPEGSVVLDGDVCVRRPDGYWKVSDLAGVYASRDITLPATVLHTPTPDPTR